MATEIVRRVTNTFTGAAGAAGTITITDKDGVNTFALAAIIIEISGTGRALDDLTTLRVGSKMADLDAIEASARTEQSAEGMIAPFVAYHVQSRLKGREFLNRERGPAREQDASPGHVGGCCAPFGPSATVGPERNMRRDDGDK